MSRLLFLIFIFTTSQGISQNILVTQGSIHFVSEAPLELIEASSDDLKGVINSDQGTFAFSVNINSFQGFNSSLQHEHFNENYMESDKFPKSTFTGKIIEKIDFSKDGVYNVRAKGSLVIHGVEQERIVRVDLIIKGDRIEISSFFSVLLKDHNITIPKIVNQKISEEIQVNIKANGSRK